MWIDFGKSTEEELADGYKECPPILTQSTKKERGEQGTHSKKSVAPILAHMFVRESNAMFLQIFSAVQVILKMWGLWKIQKTILS